MLSAPLPPNTNTNPQVQADVCAYVAGRLEQLLLAPPEDVAAAAGGASSSSSAPAPEVVRAVLVERGDDPALAARSVQQLQVCM